MTGTESRAPDDDAAAGRPSAAEVVASAVREAAFARMAVLGPHVIALVVKVAGPVTLAADATGTDQTLAERLQVGAPLTPLADPELGQDHLGAWGQQPCSVGDLLAARGRDGSRVIHDLQRQCAIEAARTAPALADELLRREPGLADRLAAEHASALTTPPGSGPVRPEAVLCAEVAALLVIELVNVVLDQLEDVPVPPTEAGPRA